jgi:hypothetical protein
MSFSHPIPLTFFATLAFSSNVVFSQPPPMPEQDYSVEFNEIPIEDARCSINHFGTMLTANGFVTTTRDQLSPEQIQKKGLSAFEDAIYCGDDYSSRFLGYDRSKAGCFEDGWLFAVRPYELQCAFTFDVNTNFSTTNHRASCTEIERVDQSKIDAFATEFAKTIFWLPPVRDGQIMRLKDQTYSVNFKCL